MDRSRRPSASDRAQPVVLVLALYYPPSQNAGGAMRTIVNMVERLGDRFDFRVITSDRDLGGDVPHRSVDLNGWNDVGAARVRYVDLGTFNLRRMRALLQEVRPDAVYLNSLFSSLAVKYLTLRRLYPNEFGNAVVLAPEGELAPDALKKAAWKKRAFLTLARIVGLHRNIIWKTAAPHEADMVRRLVPGSNRIRIAPNMPPRPEDALANRSNAAPKHSGQLQLVFLARIVPIKNLMWVLDSMEQLTGQITLDIYGPAEDANYWQQCQQKIATLPRNLKVTYRGVLGAEQVTETLAQYHFMILPTLGENFGHVVIEALAAGCPVIISDRTPWRQIADAGVGWDLSLDDVSAWRNVLQRCEAMDAREYATMSGGARSFAANWLRDPAVEEATVNVLAEATGR